ncbi:hypothetical protein HW532_18285 [Kaustia mangrovi]|uniref:Uncharacterized protein n=1 Tax=Kaustia mangrovi TaxID=2593653 RepID=A0A7S8HDN2_9HYPH|nr:hypothetical protein [Kaustia mangrovi]QPC44473.1 hypothetical protein HW532_18285 [Kaustia mangrovi]
MDAATMDRVGAAVRNRLAATPGGWSGAVVAASPTACAPSRRDVGARGGPAPDDDDLVAFADGLARLAMGADKPPEEGRVVSLHRLPRLGGAGCRSEGSPPARRRDLVLDDKPVWHIGDAQGGWGLCVRVRDEAPPGDWPFPEASGSRWRGRGPGLGLGVFAAIVVAVAAWGVAARLQLPDTAVPPGSVIQAGVAGPARAADGPFVTVSRFSPAVAAPAHASRMPRTGEMVALPRPKPVLPGTAGAFGEGDDLAGPPIPPPFLAGDAVVLPSDSRFSGNAMPHSSPTLR